jgi:hypothetical protein
MANTLAELRKGIPGKFVLGKKGVDKILVTSKNEYNAVTVG